MNLQDVACAKSPVVLSRRQQDFVDVAVTLFRKRGYPSTSIYDIGAATGLSGAALYRHFRNKEDILVAAIQQFAAAVEGASQAALIRAPEEANGRLEAIVRALVSVAMESPDQLAVYFFERRHLPDPVGPELRQRELALREQWLGLMLQARPDLSIDEAKARTEAAMVLAAQGAIDADRANTETTAPRLVEYALRVLLSDS